MRNPVGWDRHREGTERLVASFAALPADAPVRLAKSTSNLFRPRSASARGLDVSGLGGVIAVDPEARTADVQGMCTYEHLVEATLPHGLVPLVVPQLRTITLGGAVTGLGIESTSFRNGLPHESVLEMDVLTGAGELVTTSPTSEADLFAAFPNSYGSLGYAVRLRIELEPVGEHVALRHVGFSDLDRMVTAIEEIVERREWHRERVDGLDGVVFAPGEAHLTLARWVEGPPPEQVSDYTGQQIYYRSLQRRETDLLATADYLWRWDTDWFWCSGGLGLHRPWVRRVWPRRWRRSDAYHRIIALERRLGVLDRLARRRGQPPPERVVQDVEVPLDRLVDFLGWFDHRVGMRPVWLCPLRLREPTGPGSARRWPTYPLAPATTYVNVGFWGTVPGTRGAPGAVNRAIEERVRALGGHKSLYSEAFYDRADFDRLYDGPGLSAVKRRHDPDDRLTSLYDKVVGPA